MKALMCPLFVPADRPDRFQKAASSGADAVLVDLEDAVAPGAKDQARNNLRSAIGLGIPAIVRINPDGTPWHDADVDALIALGFDQVVVPKIETVDVLDAIAGRSPRSISIVALIETALGLENAAAIARHPNVAQLAFGPADFFMDLGIGASKVLAQHAICRLAVASRAAGKPLPIDGPCFAINDDGVLADECLAAIEAGAAGKLCIHPSQPFIVRDHFLPSDEEIMWAERIAASNAGSGVSVVDGKMVDAPIRARAAAILDRATSKRQHGVTA